MKDTFGERIFYKFNYTIIAISAFLCLYPFLYIVATSLSSNRAVNSGEVFLWPVEFTVEAYRQLLQHGQIFHAMRNSVVLAGFGTLFNMLLTILCAYPLSKPRLRGKGIIMGFIVFTMLFSGGMIPNFLLVRMLGLMDTYRALWFTGFMSATNMIIMRTSFQALPDSLEEAAQIDGANDPYILTRIVLPLSKAMLATISLFYLVGWWNAYFAPMLYIQSSDRYPLMVRLRQMLDTAQMITVQGIAGEGTEGAMQTFVAAESFQAATILVSVLPIICVYPLLQKYFVKGVMIGSIKG